jgi:hypothetical protein
MYEKEILQGIKTLNLRLDSIERLFLENLRLSNNAGGELHPDDPMVRYAVREMMRGNKEPQKFLSGRTMIDDHLHGGI